MKSAFQRAKTLRKSGNLAGLKTLFHDGDAATKAAVLDGLSGNVADNLGIGLGVLALAVEGAVHEDPKVRWHACQVFQQLGGYRVDVAVAVQPLLRMLNDSVAKVRSMAAAATGNLCKQKLDWSRHFEALIGLLQDKDLYVPEAAARALANFSRAKFNLSPAVTKLVNVMLHDVEYDVPAKEAAKALLHHAKKSDANRDEVLAAATKARLRSQSKEVIRFMGKLQALGGSSSSSLGRSR